MDVKKLTLPLLAATLLAFSPFAGDAFAGPHQGPRMMEQGRPEMPPMQQPALSPDQQKKLDELLAGHKNEMEPLRDALQQKRLEARLLSRNPNTKPEELKQLAADIISLRKQIRGKVDAFRESLRQAGIPDPAPMFGGPRPDDGFGGPGDCPGGGRMGMGPRHGMERGNCGCRFF